MNKNLKPVPAEKKKSLGKLPEKVRNKMGYAKKGNMMKAKEGKMTSNRRKRLKDVQNPKSEYDEKGKLKYTAAKEGKMMKQGYGAARTSGMGLQDENLIPGKSMDYYKDLM